TDTQGTDIHLAGFASVGTQDGKLDVFLGVAVRQSLVEVSSPELFPRADYLDIRTVLDKHPQVIGKVGSLVLKVSCKLLLSDREGVTVLNRSLRLYLRLGLVLGLGFGFLRSRLTTLITCICNCTCNS